MRIVPPFLIAASLAATLTSTASAQTAPPIKPGLWEIHVEHQGGPATPDVSEHMKNMPPEQRKHIEAMMKERGVDMSGGMNKVKICLDKASMDQGRWQGEQAAHCKTDKSNTGTVWRWHAVCGEPYNSVTDGEATFTNAETYVVKTKTTMTIRGKSQTTQSTIQSKWMGANCGDIKPIQAMKPPSVPQGAMGQRRYGQPAY